MRFKDKVIIITGGAYGIGAATAQLFVEEGACVYIWDIHCPGYAAANVHWVPCDVSKPYQVEQAIAIVQQIATQIDYLVCNAGVHLFADIEHTSVAELHDVIETNLCGTVYCLQQVLPIMKQQRFGIVVLMGSDQAFIAKQQCAIYGATKAAIAQLAKSTALDYAVYNIRVNCICPGTINTAMYQSVIRQLEQRDGLTESEVRAAIATQLPLQRIGEAAEVARVVGFLCSDAASFMTGALVRVDGGYTIQ